jgi:hypothetical protein
MARLPIKSGEGRPACVICASPRSRSWTCRSRTARCGPFARKSRCRSSTRTDRPSVAGGAAQELEDAEVLARVELEDVGHQPQQ